MKDLCENLKSARPSRLNLNVDGASLFQLAHTDLALSGLENSVPVSLAEGVIGNESELAPKGRLCLAFVLSYALLDFCGEPWFPSGWTKKGIWCLQTGGQLLLRPALVTHMRSPSAMPRPSRSSNDLRLLFHGILMMEIFNQAEFPLQIDVGEDADINNLRNVARHEFDAVNWDVYEGFQQSVEACINGNRVDDVDPAATSEDSFVATFCRIVLRPLATDFHSVWGNRDPDEAILELKMPSIKKLPGIGRKPLHLQVYLRFTPHCAACELTSTDLSRKTGSTNKSKTSNIPTLQSTYSCRYGPEYETRTRQVLRCCRHYGRSTVSLLPD